jgi:uncharacterized glyoxalase superfamily protein PhnB
MHTDASTCFPVLRYRDAAAAIDWLGRAFGLEPIEDSRDSDGKVVHAELRLGDGIVMLGSENGSDWGSHAGTGWVYVAIGDADALHARATAAGAELVRALEDTDYGSRDFTVRDHEGNLWSFGTYRPSPSSPLPDGS